MGYSMKGFGKPKQTDDSNNMTKGAASMMNQASAIAYKAPIQQRVIREGKITSGRDPRDLGAGSEYAGETTTTGRVIPEGGFRRGEETVSSVGARQRTGSKQGVGDTREIVYTKEGGMSTFITPEGRYHADEVSTEEYRKGYGRIHTGKQEVTTHYRNPKSKEASASGYAPKWSEVKDKRVAGSGGYSADGTVIERQVSRITPRKSSSAKPSAKVPNIKRK